MLHFSSEVKLYTESATSIAVQGAKGLTVLEYKTFEVESIRKIKNILPKL